MISGTSAGALFGAMYAAGRSIEEISKFAVSIPREYSLLTGFKNWDVRVPPRAGLIKGNALLNHIRKWIFDKTFDDLKIPLAVVTVDLISGEEIVFDRGPVAEAVRASMSVGGLLEPAQHNGRYLIDGGAVNPVPVQALADKGVNLILASNVIPNVQDRLRRRRLQNTKRLPGLVDIVLGEREIMESEIIRTRIQPVNVLIQPDVARYHVREYDKVADIIRSGEEAAQLQIPFIRKLLAPRPRKMAHD
jgi:NTE family protein